MDSDDIRTTTSPMTMLSEPAAAAAGTVSPAMEHDGVDAEVVLQALRQSKRELEVARKQFETVTDPMLIDHIVFRLGAAEKHFNYLFQLARKSGVSFEGMRWEWYEDD